MKSKTKKLFVATSAFLAFVDRAHPKHVEATAYFNFLASKNYQLYTCFGSINEAYRKIYSDLSPTLARDFLKAITLGSINILYPSESDLKAAIKALTASQSKELTFLDAQAETLAYRNGITEILTFDYIPQLFGIEVFTLPV